MLQQTCADANFILKFSTFFLGLNINKLMYVVYIVYFDVKIILNFVILMILFRYLINYDKMYDVIV